MSNAALRALLADKYGAGRFRIARDGEIHINGVMPNTNIVGWYLYGRVDSPETLAALDAGRTPSADEIRAAREAAGLSRRDAAALVHASVRGWEKWEQGERSMHPAFWELFRSKLPPR